MTKRAISLGDDDIDTGLRPLSLPPDEETGWLKTLGVIGLVGALGFALIAFVQS
jgi:hypothetical protein